MFWSATAVSLLLGFPQNNTNQTLVFFIALSILVSAATSVWRNGLPGLTGRSSTALPKMFILRANRPNQRFEAEMSAIRQATDQRTVFVYFNEMRRGFLPPEDQLVEYFPLRKVVEVADGTIFKSGSD